MKTLGDLVQSEIARSLDLLVDYAKCPTGAFGVMQIKQEILKTTWAALTADLVALLAAYKKLKENQ